MKSKELGEKLDEKEKGCNFSLRRVSRFIQPGLLLFLSKKPSHGYELIDKLKLLGFHKKNIDIGSVYRILRKMEKEFLVKSSWKTKGSRRKRVYQITPHGRRLLKAWVERIKERKNALENFLDFYQREKL